MSTARMGIGMSRRGLSWWQGAVKRYEAGTITLAQGAAEAGIDKNAFRAYLVGLGAKIKTGGRYVRPELDPARVDALVQRYADGEPGASMLWLATELGVSTVRAREEICARGVPIRLPRGGLPEAMIGDRPPGCRHCGFLVGSRCRCDVHRENRRGA